jgi:hypothetical protein
VRHIHLARSARLAGEAFAFAEPQAAPTRERRLPLGGMAWLFIAAAGVAAYVLT